MQQDPLVVPATSCPGEPVPTAKHIMWPVDAKCFHSSFAKYAFITQKKYHIMQG